MNPVDKDFFFKHLGNICSRYTPYGQESKLHPLIIPFLEKCGFQVKTGKEAEPNNKTAYDAIYAVRGKNPDIIFNAHLDIVGGKKNEFPFKIPPRPRKYKTAISDDGGCRFILDTKYENKINNYNKRIRHIKRMKELGIEQEIIRDKDTAILKEKDAKGHEILYAAGPSLIGGDDRCGIATCMALAQSFNRDCKILLTTGEEVGHGSRDSWVEFFKDVNYSFTIDRRGDTDFVKDINGRVLQSDNFRSFMIDIGKKHKPEITVVSGAMADAYSIAEHVPETFNCSAGYHFPHSEEEYIDVDQLYTTYMWMLEAAHQIYEKGIKPEPKPEIKTYKPYVYTKSGKSNKKHKGQTEYVYGDTYENHPTVGIYNHGFNNKWKFTRNNILKFPDVDCELSLTNGEPMNFYGDVVKVISEFTKNVPGLGTKMQCVQVWSYVAGKLYEFEVDEIENIPESVTQVAYQKADIKKELLEQIERVKNTWVILKKTENEVRQFEDKISKTKVNVLQGEKFKILDVVVTYSNSHAFYMISSSIGNPKEGSEENENTFIYMIDSEITTYPIKSDGAIRLQSEPYGFGVD